MEEAEKKQGSILPVIRVIHRHDETILLIVCVSGVCLLAVVSLTLHGCVLTVVVEVG